MEMLLIFFLIWVPSSIFIGWLASRRGRSGVAWCFLSLLVSPVICLFAVLIMPDLAAEAIKQAREESRFRDQLAVLSDIKAKTQTPDVASKLKAKPQVSVAATAAQPPATHQEKPQPEAVIAPVSTSASQAMAATALSPSQSLAANAGKPAARTLKRKAFNPMVVAIGVLIVAVVILAAYVFYLQKPMNQQKGTVPSVQKFSLESYKVEEYEDPKIKSIWRRIIINVDGNSLIGPDDQYVTIEAQGDFNGDGIADALIHTNCGGSACVDEFQFVSIFGGKIVTAPVHISNPNDFQFMEYEGRPVVKTTNGSEMVYWGFDGQKTIKVNSIQLPFQTISSTVLCLQNKRKTACPEILDVIRDDKIFKDNLNLILKKSRLSPADINSFFLDGATSGFKLLIKNGRQYLKADWHSRSVDADLTLLVEIKGDTSGSENRLTAIFNPNERDASWLNAPTDVEKDILNSPDSDSKTAEPATVKAESKTPTPMELNRNAWFTPESGFTECIEARSGPAGRIEDSKGMSPSVVEKDGGRIVQVKAYRDQGNTIVKWMFYRDKSECERVETNVEKKMADKYR